MAEIKDILFKLLERTNQHKVIWKATANERAFIAILGEASLMIQQEDDYDFILRIHNQDGREVEELDSNTAEGRQSRGELQKLHSMARRIALEGDRLLEKLMEELEAEV